MQKTKLAALAFALFLSCAALAAEPIRTYTVRPRDTDPAIDTASNPHAVLAADCARQTGRLLLFLPGAGGAPSTAHPLPLLAPLSSLHAISLSYPNERPVFNDCVRERAEPDCYAAW